MDNARRTGAGVASEKELLLHEAVITNDAELVRKILGDGQELNVNCRNNYARTPIHLASSRGNSDILKMLIEANCDIEARDKFGMRPLHMAVWYGQQEAVDVLFKAGALHSVVDKKQRTLLMMASHSKNGASLIEFITSKLESAVDPEARDCEGASALHHAARAGHPEAIGTLARLVPGLELDLRDQRGRTALHYACAEGQQEAAVRLVELGSSISLQDSEGRTALHLATASRESWLCNWLLGRCSDLELANLLRLADHKGFTLVHVAASLGCILILRCLLELDQQPRQALEARCQRGNTPLHLAALNRQLQVVDFLVERGASLRTLNHEKRTPLELAKETGHNQVCRSLAAAEEADEEREAAREKRTLRVVARSSLASIASTIARTARLDHSELLLEGTRALFDPPDQPNRTPRTPPITEIIEKAL